MKFFKKIRKSNGKRFIYFCGLKIYSYKRGHESIEKRGRRLGVKIGEGTRIMQPAPIFGSEPYLIEIGKNCLLSHAITFLTHDGCVHTLKQFCNNPEEITKFGRIKIGDNCFIGCESTILPNVTIGNNCIIGACSVVTKNVPDNEVWAGNPAHFITTTQELAKKVEKLSATSEQKELAYYVRQMRGKNKIKK